MYGVKCPNCGSDDIADGLNFEFDENGKVFVPEAEYVLAPSCRACDARLEIDRRDPNLDVRVKDKPKE